MSSVLHSNICFSVCPDSRNVSKFLQFIRFLQKRIDESIELRIKYYKEGLSLKKSFSVNSFDFSDIVTIIRKNATIKTRNNLFIFLQPEISRNDSVNSKKSTMSYQFLSNLNQLWKNSKYFINIQCILMS